MRMLHQCKGLWEARIVLDSSHKLITKAIASENKEFVAHHYSQVLLSEDWYGEFAYTFTSEKIKIAMRYIMSPVLLPLFILYYILWEKCNRVSLPNSRFGKHMNLLFTPIVCFITDVLNYMILLISLYQVCVCVLNGATSPPQKRFFCGFVLSLD